MGNSRQNLDPEMSVALATGLQIESTEPRGVCFVMNQTKMGETGVNGTTPTRIRHVEELLGKKSEQKPKEKRVANQKRAPPNAHRRYRCRYYGTGVACFLFLSGTVEKSV